MFCFLLKKKLFFSKLTCYSNTGQRKAVVVEIGNGADAYDLLQIWNQDLLEKSYDLKELGSHKTIYTPGDLVIRRIEDVTVFVTRHSLFFRLLGYNNDLECRGKQVDVFS